MKEQTLSSFEDVRIEVAAHHLLLRALFTYLACGNGKAAHQTLTEICGMLEGIGPFSVEADDLDDALRNAAIDRVRTRMAHFIAGIDRLPMARG